MRLRSACGKFHRARITCELSITTAASPPTHNHPACQPQKSRAAPTRNGGVLMREMRLGVRLGSRARADGRSGGPLRACWQPGDPSRTDPLDCLQLLRNPADLQHVEIFRLLLRAG